MIILDERGVNKTGFQLFKKKELSRKKLNTPRRGLRVGTNNPKSSSVFIVEQF